MRLRSVRNDLRGTDFAELMRLVGRYVDVHFAQDDRGVEFGRVCEVEAPPCAYACDDATPLEEYCQVDACAPGIAAPEPLTLELHACAPGALLPHAHACENAALLEEHIQADACAAPTAEFELPAPGLPACAPGTPRPEPPASAPRACAPRASLVQGDVGLAPTARPSAVPASARKAALSPSRANADLDDLLRHLDAGFTQTLLRLIDERGFSDSQVYKRANISRQLFSKIRKDDSYRPTKQTALALGVALELELDELATLLERAGYALTHSSKADVIVEYFVTNGCYDVHLINEALYAFDQPLLGSNAA